MRLRHRPPAPMMILFLLLLSPPPAWAYEEIKVVQGGSLRGTVHWKNPSLPERVIHKVTKNPDFCGKTFEDDALLVNPENRGMKNVVVYLENIERGRTPQNRYVNIIEKCRFKPRVMPMVRNKVIGFLHNDFILHNIHGFRFDNNSTLFNIGLPIHRWQQVVTQTVKRSGLIRLQCDIHAHMNGLILSLEHDYFAVTDADGRFEIKDIPPGTYQLVALQAGYQIQSWESAEDEGGNRPIYEAPHRILKEVEITADGIENANFEFGLEEPPHPAGGGS